MPTNLSTDNSTILPTLSNAVEPSGSSSLLVSETTKLVSTSLQGRIRNHVIAVSWSGSTSLNDAFVESGAGKGMDG